MLVKLSSSLELLIYFSIERAAKLEQRRRTAIGGSRNLYNTKMEEESVKLSRSRDRKNKLSMNTNKSSQGDKLSLRSSSTDRKKPSLIDLNINMNSLNDMLKNIIETINQHAVLLNNISNI